MNQQEIQKTISNYWDAENKLKTIEELVMPIVDRIRTLHKNNRPLYDCSDKELSIGNNTIDFSWDEYHCGETDHESISFPTSYLWTTNWEELELAVIEKERQEGIEEGKRRVEREQERTKKEKLVLYNKLQVELGIKETK